MVISMEYLSKGIPHMDFIYSYKVLPKRIDSIYTTSLYNALFMASYREKEYNDSTIPFREIVILNTSFWFNRSGG